VDPPKYWRCSHGREQAGGAALKLHKGRRRITRIGWRLLRMDTGVDFDDWADQVHERIEHM